MKIGGHGKQKCQGIQKFLLEYFYLQILSLAFLWGGYINATNYCTIALISHASKVMLKILQARLQQYVNHELPDIEAGFRKDRGARNQIANILWIMEKAREFQKNI